MATAFILGLIALLLAAIVAGAYGFVVWERHIVSPPPEAHDTPLTL